MRVTDGVSVRGCSSTARLSSTLSSISDGDVAEAMKVVSHYVMSAQTLKFFKVVRHTLQKRSPPDQCLTTTQILLCAISSLTSSTIITCQFQGGDREKGNGSDGEIYESIGRDKEVRSTITSTWPTS
jgi:hypothetical protein